MNKLVLFLGTVAFFLFTGLAYSQCSVRYGTPYCAPNHFNRPIVREIVQVVESPVVPIVPVAYPVLVPAFQFQYNPPVVVQQVVQAPPQVSYPQAPVQSSTPQVGNMYGGGQQDKIKELAKALIDEMRRQSDQDLNGDGPPMAIDHNAQPASPGVPIAPIPQPVDSGKEQAGPFAISALSRACAQCHTGIGSKGDTIIFSSPGVLNPGAPLRSMRREIDAGRMPPQYFHYRLTPQELQALRIWLPPVRE